MCSLAQAGLHVTIWDPCSRAEQSALVPWLLGLQSQTKLQLFWTWAKLITDALCDAWGCPCAGHDPPSVPQAGSVITPGMAAVALLTLQSFLVILPFLHKVKI